MEPHLLQNVQYDLRKCAVNRLKIFPTTKVISFEGSASLWNALDISKETTDI